MSLLLDYSFGQRKTLSVLNKIISSNNIPHALLFSGPEGVGKFQVAFNLAKQLNANSANPNVLAQIEKLAEPYIKLIVPLPRGKGETNDDTATAKLPKDTIEEIQSEINKIAANPFHKIYIEGANNIKISSIRDIKKFISIDYSDIGSRMIIINDAHLMNDEAQNALLKSLEEPPPGVIFVLITPYKDQLLDTIKSRCWQINFEPLQYGEVENILVKYYSMPQEDAEVSAYFSNGSVRMALMLYENDINYLLEKTIEILRFSLARRYNSALKSLNEFIADDPQLRILILIRLINKWLVDVVRDKAEYNEFYFEPYKETVKKFNSRFSHIPVESVYTSIDRMSGYLKRNINLNIISLNIIFELASIGMR